jgi:hypothetical protein
MTSALPRDVLFEDGDAAPDIPVVDHYCGVEARMRKSLQLQAGIDRKSTRLNSSHNPASRMPSSA